MSTAHESPLAKAWREATSPDELLDLLDETTASERKLRLFVCACVRRIWHLLDEPASREAVEVAERYADGGLSFTQLVTAYRDETVRTGRQAVDGLASLALHPVPTESVGWPGGATTFAPIREALEAITRFSSEAEEVYQAALLRDIFLPFTPITVEPAWQAANDGLVGNLAGAIYAERAFDRLPILGDALEDAGCTDARLLDHARGPGPHVRGCWLIDALLSRTTSPSSPTLP